MKFFELYQRIVKARAAEAIAHGRDVLSALDITCDLCHDVPWWAANGFTEEERQAMCGPQGINCKGMDG